MSIEQLAGENQGIWTYLDKHGQFICYTVRTFDKETNKKEVKPWVAHNGSFKIGGFAGKPTRPLYNQQYLGMYPDKPILLVEGEKTADAGKKYFSEMNCLTWMGGCKMAEKADISLLAGKEVYLLPDADENGYTAMKVLRDRLLALGCTIHFVDIMRLGVPEHWDIADLDDDEGCVSHEDVFMAVRECPVYKKVFDPSTYPVMSEGNKPRPLDVIENAKYLLGHYGIVPRWNMMKRIREIDIPGKTLYKEEAENISLHEIQDLAIKNGLSDKRMDGHLDVISFENAYHPIRDWILSKPCKTPGILDEFVNIIPSTNPELSGLLFKRWLMSAVYAAFSEGEFTPQGVLIFQGAQGKRKSAFLQSLVPKEFEAFVGGKTINPSIKDDVFAASEAWIMELAEIDGTFKQADMARLKAFITTSFDICRRPFARRNSRLVRRSVIAASVNHPEFLTDTTGNRRWWTITIPDGESLNPDHGFDMQQVFADALRLKSLGERAWLTDDEILLLNSQNQKSEIQTAAGEMLLMFYDFDTPMVRYMSCTQILMEMGAPRVTNKERREVGAALRKMGFKTSDIRKYKDLYPMPLAKDRAQFSFCD